MNDSFVVKLWRLHSSTTSHNAVRTAEMAAAIDESFALLPRPAMRASASSDCVIFSSGKSGTRGPSARDWPRFRACAVQRRWRITDTKRVFPWITVREQSPAQAMKELLDGDCQILQDDLVVHVGSPRAMGVQCEAMKAEDQANASSSRSFSRPVSDLLRWGSRRAAALKDERQFCKALPSTLWDGGRR